MIAMTLAEIAAAVAGRAEGPPDTEVTGAAFVDSRAGVPGGLFVAVPGSNVDGHDFAAEAVRNGAAAVLSQRPLGLPGIVVADSVEAVGMLAHHLLSRLGQVRPGPARPDLVSGRTGDAGLTAVGITGSQGKTTTKDLLAQLLESVDDTVASVGSYNNEIGVPLTALRATETTRFLVVEMGSRGAGHIHYLASMVRPLVGVVLNVGVAHLAEFGSVQGIARAKGELVESLPEQGVAVLNADDALVAGMRGRTSARVITFGEGDRADVRLSDVRLDDSAHVRFGLSYLGSHQEVTLPLVGAHHARNAAAAAAAAIACGMPFDRVCGRLAAVEARSRWRMETATNAHGVTVINDAYNANPDSMRAALDTLSVLGRRRGGRTFAVLGEMRELGASAPGEHEAIGRLVARLNISRLVTVGEQARLIHLGATQDPTWGGDSACVRHPAEAVDLLASELRPGDVVLVKASRAAGLEGVGVALLDDPAATR